MGITFSNCDVCDNIYHDCSDYGSCETCGKSWCDDCKDMNEVKQFIFNGKLRCTLCWKEEPKRVKKSVLFDYITKKLRTTYEELEDEFRAQAGPEYREPKDRYFCTECYDNECASVKCEYIDYNIGYEVHDEIQYRGWCCKAYNRHNTREDYYELCKGCKKWERQRIQTILLGVHKFRPDSLLKTIHKDVLKYMAQTFL